MSTVAETSKKSTPKKATPKNGKANGNGKNAAVLALRHMIVKT